MTPPHLTAAQLSQWIRRQLATPLADGAPPGPGSDGSSDPNPSHAPGHPSHAPGHPSHDRQGVVPRAQVAPVHWCRVIMNRAAEDFMSCLPRHTLDVLEVSGSSWSDPRFGFRSYRSLAYPEYDICQAPLQKEFCDLLILEQVLEHVRRPHQAVAHALAMLRPGGRILVSTPFLLKFHPCPLDLYRWTEDGLRVLLEEAGFISIVTGSWGNRRCLAADMQPGLAWTYYDPAVHSLENEIQFPIVVWAFAQKPPAG